MTHPLLQANARIQQLLRVLLVAFFVAVFLTEPPAHLVILCWLITGSYAGWTLVIAGLSRRVDPRRFLSAQLGVDLVVLIVLTLATDTTAAVSWTPYLLLNGFFLVPVLVATQPDPVVCTVVGGIGVAAYLVSALLVRSEGEEPVSYVVLRTAALGIVTTGSVLLTRLQRLRIATITGLADDRTALLADLTQVERRERQSLAETLHDGALQYLLAGRQDLDDLEAGDADAASRIRHALTTSARLLRSTTSQLHPAVLEQAGLRLALADLVEETRTRGHLNTRLIVEGWDENTRTDADDLLLATARELLANTLKHARAHTIVVTLTQISSQAVLRVSDDGVGIDDVDLASRLAEGHLGLASRRTRVEAAGGTFTVGPATPHGTTVEARIPLLTTPDVNRSGDRRFPLPIGRSVDGARR